MTAWEKEKAYCEKRAKKLAAKMEAAIEASDRISFQAAYQTAMRYMKKKELNCYYMAFIRKGA